LQPQALWVVFSTLAGAEELLGQAVHEVAVRELAPYLLAGHAQTAEVVAVGVF